jgi:serine/threonine protein kinase/tetratricopeptide (TPR) repeat protein
LLDDACGNDAELRHAVEALLAHHDDAGAFLGAPTLDPPPSSATGSAQEFDTATIAEGPGSVIGNYKLLREIGEGGFGTVYHAEQLRPVRRDVALKIIKLGMDTKQVIARFDAERQALAMMDHPNIAKVFDAGSTEAGRPFFVMELVKGVPITEYCDTNRLTIRERLDLFVAACRAVQHAHQKGIIHRDIKPSNVMVTLLDGRPAPKVIDFGIAKATNSRLTEQTLLTEQRQLVGTPQYMSPEQADAGALDIDTRTDIYSLGVLLYELLTGVTPFDRERLQSASYFEIQRMIREEEPPRPSVRLSALGLSAEEISLRRRELTPHLTRALRGDLDWIVMKALEKDRARRYETANALAVDIIHHLHDEPVEASPPGTIYRLNKLIRRHRGPVAAAAVIALLLVGGATGTTIGLVRAVEARMDEANQRERAQASAARADREATEAREQAAIAQTEAAKAQAVLDFLSDIFAAADPQTTGDPDVTVRQVLDDAVAALDDGSLADQPLVDASVRATIGRIHQGLGLYDEAQRQLTHALELRRDHLDPAHPDIATNLSFLGSIARDRGDESAAEKHFRDALDVLEARGDVPNDRLANVLNNLGLLLWDQRNYGEASRLLERALEIDRELHGDGDADLASSLNNMALLARDMGDYERAERYFEEAMDILINTYGEDHMHVATVLESLGSIQLERGEFGHAEAKYRRALEIRRAALGERHPHVTVSLNNLGYLLYRKGEYDAAEPLYRESLDIRREVLGPDHPGVALALSNIALLLSEKGELEEAEEACRQAVAIRREKLGPSDPRTLLVMHRFAIVLHQQGRFAEAREQYQELIELSRRAADAPDAPAPALHQAADILLQCKFDDLRDPAVAREYARLACERTGYENAEYLDTLALALHRLGRHADAAETQRRAIAALPIGSARYEDFNDRLRDYDTAASVASE